jgi:hypothetical protein
MKLAHNTDFDNWLVKVFAEVGWFTLLIIVVDIGEGTVSPLASSYAHIIGDETRWADIVNVMAVADVPWNGAAFFRIGSGGFVDDAMAQEQLSSLTRNLEESPSLFRDSRIFDPNGGILSIAVFNDIERSLLH